MKKKTGKLGKDRASSPLRPTSAPTAGKKQIVKAVSDHDRETVIDGDPNCPVASRVEAKNCVALHSFEGLDLDQITSITPRQDYSGMHAEELLDYGVAAVEIAKLGGRFSRPVFLELDKRLKAGKKSKDYFLGFKSIEALCKHIGISRKHFYNVINDNRSGRKPLSLEEQAAKDAAKEQARIKREEARADREAKRRAEKERLKREAEELKAAREDNKKLQQSLDKKDDDVAKAKQAGVDEAISKAATAAAQKEKRPQGFSPDPKTDRDLYYFTIGAQSVRGVNLGSPSSVVKIVLQLLDGQTAGRQQEEIREILSSLSVGVEDRVNKLGPPTAPEPISVESHEEEQARLRAEYDARWDQAGKPDPDKHESALFGSELTARKTEEIENKSPASSS